MTYINSEGKFNDNSYMMDGWVLKLEKHLALYIIENDGERIMIDAGVPLSTRKVVKKLKEFGLFPIQKIILTHSHWDHVQACSKIKNLMKNKIEIYASENAIENLKDPDKMNKFFGMNIEPIEDVIPLKEGDIINLKGLNLEIINFFGHTMDSIAILDRYNKNIFVGDAIIDRYSRDTVIPTFVPHDFHENELLKTFQKLRNLKDEFNSISLPHYGVWTNEDFDKILNEMEELHFKTKNAIIEWYSEKQELEYITKKYHETFIPNSTIHRKGHLLGLELMVSWLVEALKLSGFIK